MKIILVAMITVIVSACTTPQPQPVKKAPANPVHYTTVEIPK